MNDTIWADGVWADGVWAEGVWAERGTATPAGALHFRSNSFNRRRFGGLFAMVILTLIGVGHG
jgi:hypothetical protein